MIATAELRAILNAIPPQLRTPTFFDGFTGEKPLPNCDVEAPRQTSMVKLPGRNVASEPPICSYIGVERGLAEFRCGRPVVILGDRLVAAMPLDGCGDELLQLFRRTFDVTAVKLAVSARRAYALGIETHTPMSIQTPKQLTTDDVLAVTSEKSLPRGVQVTGAGIAVTAGIDLAKLAGRLPAVLTADLTSADHQGDGFAKFEAAAVTGFRQHLVDSLEIAASSAMTLDGVEAARLVVFRDAIGSESVALIVRDLDPSRPVLVRLHSECLGGDVLWLSPL